MTTQRITVEDARRLADQGGKDCVVLMLWSFDGMGTQFVTWGRGPMDKVHASETAEKIGAELCGPRLETYEDFKLDAAKNKARVERLLAACGAAIRHLDLANDDPTGRTYPLYVELRDAIAYGKGEGQ